MSALRWALHRFSRLSWPERRVLGEALVLLPLVHQLQQRLSFERWHPLLHRPGPGRFGSAPLRASVGQVAWAIGVGGDWLPGEYKCLPRAYATHVLLAHHGHVSEVRVGVARDPHDKVEAHAWVVCEGRTVMGQVDDLERFVPLPELSRAFS